MTQSHFSLILKFLIASATFLLCCNLFGQQKTEIAGFSIEFPCECELKTDTSQMFKTTYLKQCSSGDGYFELKITSFFNGMYHSDSIENLDFDLDYSQREFVNTYSADLIGLMLKSVKGYPGKEFRFKYKLEDKYRFSRIYIVQNNLVELTYEGPSSKIYTFAVSDFFDSFSPTTYKENPTPYLDFPTDEELANRPFIANFGGKTRQKADANQTDFGKFILVVEIREFEPNEEHGILGLSVLYGDHKDRLSENDKVELLKAHLYTQEHTYPNFRWIKKNDPEDGRLELEFEYTIKNEKVIDVRRVFFEANRLYSVSGIVKKSKYPSNQLNDFIVSFRLK